MTKRHAPTVFNTLNRQKEELKPQDNQSFHIYACGPTVYDFAHIGNFRTYIFCDLFRRTLKYFGWGVEHVMNITDVDDKTIHRSQEAKMDLKEYTEKYTKYFFDDLETLNIEKVEKVPKATEWIEPMCQMIQKLMEKGIAYKGTDDSIYFKIDQYQEYGRLSHLNLDELVEGASKRVASDEYDKDCACDFVLWKAYDAQRDGQVYWDSPFGRGRPGWHIECSVMATELLGKTIDVHLGGVDLVFPHHENEIAQCQACYNQKFANYWVHAEHLLVDHKKMSKSLGNFYTLRNLLDKGYGGKEIRYLLLSNHYRTQFNFTLDGLKAAKQALARLQGCVDRLIDYQADSHETSATNDSLLDQTLNQFDKALLDDFNISVALAALFNLVKELNVQVDAKQLSMKQKNAALDLFKKIDQVIGVLSFQETESIPSEVSSLLDERIQAKKDKNYARADEIRDQIFASGYEVIDTPSGSKVVKAVGV